MLSDDFQVIGYLPDYRSLEPSWGNCLTDLIYFSAEPLANGGLDTHRLNPETLQSLRDVRERYGTRIHISVGGFRRSDNFSEMATNSRARKNFVENLVAFCKQYDLDGVDFDWEFPENETEFQSYIALIREVQQRGLFVSVALYPTEDLVIQPYLVADRIHVMSYDRGAQHATFQQAVEDLQLFTNNGIPKEKLMLGIPFYGRQTSAPSTSFAYSEIIEQYHPPPDSDEVAGIYFNGITTVERKTCYAQENGYGGIMIWELGQDSGDETSLLRAAFRAVIGGCEI
ncbi:MAG: hypothetical protein GTO14_13695 [Anaerolineales bacterium]|nr:hypothetical protein [Anaerolineales bacterium]